MGDSPRKYKKSGTGDFLNANIRNKLTGHRDI
jgi:hypothetical protein